MTGQLLEQPFNNWIHLKSWKSQYRFLKHLYLYEPDFGALFLKGFCSKIELMQQQDAIMQSFSYFSL